VRTDAPAAAATSAPAAAAPARRAQATMDQATFWRLMADTRKDGGNDTARQSQLLAQRLRHLPAPAIAEYQRIRHQLDVRAYTWDVWGAAYVIEDGCSDDCFRDFRAYLISLGPDAFERAMRDPDSLAGVVQDAELGDWEDADSVAGDAYQEVAGEDLPVSDSDLSGPPRGQPWDDDQAEQLVQRYPKLAAEFRG
jgi:hypothetical protein